MTRRPHKNLFDSEDDFPSANHILNTQLPKFKILFIERYDGSGAPDDHLQNYKTVIRLREATCPLLCMVFPITLRKSAKEWFNNLQRGSITSFREFAYVFV